MVIIVMKEKIEGSEGRTRALSTRKKEVRKI